MTRAIVCGHLTTVTIEGGPFTPTLSTELELVLLVGYPSMGKSRLYRNHFGPAGYEHINQDVLGNRSKCVSATEKAVAEGKSCVIGMHSVSPSWQLELQLIRSLFPCR